MMVDWELEEEAFAEHDFVGEVPQDTAGQHAQAPGLPQPAATPGTTPSSSNGHRQPSLPGADRMAAFSTSTCYSSSGSRSGCSSSQLAELYEETSSIRRKQACPRTSTEGLARVEGRVPGKCIDGPAASRILLCNGTVIAQPTHEESLAGISGDLPTGKQLEPPAQIYGNTLRCYG